MADDKDKSELIETVTEQIEIIDKLPLHPKNKLETLMGMITWM